MTAIEYLDQQVKAACPNATGVSVRHWQDKSTWRANGPLTANEQQAAQAIFDAYSVAAGPPPSPEEMRCAGFDASIQADPTVQTLKAMTNAQFDAWWDANVTTAAQAIAVLKRITRVIIRKVL